MISGIVKIPWIPGPNYPGERIVVHVPLESDAGVFKLRPTSFTTVWPRGQVKNDELLLTIDYPRGQTFEERA